MSDESTDLGSTATEIGPEIGEALESKVEAGLASVFSGQDDLPDDPEPSENVKESAEAQVDAAAPVDGAEPAEGTESPESATDTQPADEPAAAPSAPTIPAAYVRSLKALEWTDEEIAEAAKLPNFLTTAAKLHASRNKQISEWAEAGRKAREQAPVKDAGQQSQVVGGLQPLDSVKLKAKYGNDDLIDELVGPVNKVIENINAVMPVVQQTQQRSQQAELEMLGKQIDGFFGGKDLEPYRKVYGEVGKQLSTEQIDTRNKVLEFADALVAGARIQGRSLSVGEALALAHDSVSSGFKTEAVRSEVQQTLKTRERGISLRPSARGAGAGSEKVNSRAALERKVSAGLRSTFSS